MGVNLKIYIYFATECTAVVKTIKQTKGGHRHGDVLRWSISNAKQLCNHGQ